MKKEDNKMELKVGMIVECRNGERYLVRQMYNNLFGSNNTRYINLHYDEELNENKFSEKDFDIMKIYISNAFVLTKLFDDDCLTCIWERKEPKKMTLSEISKALGFPVEIVDNMEEASEKLDEVIELLDDIV